jgi:hypothetical protein
VGQIRYGSGFRRIGRWPVQVFKTAIPLEKPRKTTNYSTLTFDFYCQSLQDKLVKRVCGHCGLYFCIATALTSHRKLQKSLPTTTIDFVDEVVEDKSDGNGIFIIKNPKIG